MYGTVYLVDRKHFTSNMLCKWRATIPDKAHRVPSAKLSSMSLADPDASDSRRQNPPHSKRTHDDDGGVGAEEGSGSDVQSSVEQEEEVAVDTERLVHRWTMRCRLATRRHMQ